MSLPTDEYFCRMMEQVWCISEDASSEATQSQVKFLIQTMRAKLLSKANNTTEEYLLRQLFESFDTNKSGDLTIDELWAMAAKLEISVERKYLAALFKVIDADNSGTIEFEEFCNFLINSPYK
jgi:Ca2+-binding EF-hand superfamily protein